MSLQPDNARILIIDDMESARKSLIHELGLLGFRRIEVAVDGDSALQMLEIGAALGELPHLLICDWMMPNLSGLELLTRIRSNPEFRTIPFLMVTAEGETKRIVEAAKAGATSYIIKPITAETLKAKVMGILAKIP